MEHTKYLAGLTDGDGNIDLAFESKRLRFRPRLRFMMHTNKDLDDIFSKFGFAHYKHPSGNGCETFILENKKAIDMVKRLYPYLVLKKIRAKLLLEAWDIMPGKNKPYTKEIIEKLVNIKDEMRKHRCRQSPFIYTAEKIKECFASGEA